MPVAKKLNENEVESVGLKLVSDNSAILNRPTGEPGSYTHPGSGLDLDRLVYEGERKHLLAITRDPVLGPLMRDTNVQLASTQAEAELAKNALKLDLRFSPMLQEVTRRCQEVLKLKMQLSVYVVSNPNYNAFCMPSEEGTIRIGLTSSLLEKFTPAELAFVMGHEIGHALYRHSHSPSVAAISSGGPQVTPLHVMRVLAWKRAAEVTADRIGLLCGESFESSARTLFKVSYGFDITEAEAIRHYVEEFRTAGKSFSDHIAPEDFFATHPFGPVRLLALETFSRGRTFGDFRGQAGQGPDHSETEKLIEEIISVFESSYLNNPGALQQDVQEFLFLGGVAIAASDGEVAESEVATLGAILHRAVTPEEINTILTAGPQEAWKRIQTLGSALYTNLSHREHLVLLRDLCMIAMADGKIMQSEFDVLAGLAGTLHVIPKFIEDVLTGAVQGLD